MIQFQNVWKNVYLNIPQHKLLKVVSDNELNMVKVIKKNTVINTILFYN